MKAHSLVHSITSQYCMYEQTCIYTAYNPQSQRKKKKKHSRDFHNNHFSQKTLNGDYSDYETLQGDTAWTFIACQPWKKHLQYTPTLKKNPTYICMHVLHHQADPHLHSSYTYKWTRKQTHGIYCGLGCPRRISHVPKTKYLQIYFIFYLHSHLAFCMFVLECAKTCMCQCVHVLCRSCLLRRWIKQKVHLICKTLQGKHTHTHAHACIQHQNHFRHRIYS